MGDVGLSTQENWGQIEIEIEILHYITYAFSNCQDECQASRPSSDEGCPAGNIALS